MDNSQNFFSGYIRKYKNSVHYFLDNKKYKEADELIKNELRSLSLNSHFGVVMTAESAGLLIDVATEEHNREAALLGIELITKNYEKFVENGIAENSIEYCLGNGFFALYRIISEENDFEFRAENITHLIDAKNHYWKAYKLSLNSDHLFSDLLINLGNTLNSSGRIVEAIYYYDTVINTKQFSPQAYDSRGAALLTLRDQTHLYSLYLSWKAMQDYNIASNSIEVPKWISEGWRERYNYLHDFLNNQDISYSDILNDISEVENKVYWHTDFRHFCLENYLSLSEHAVYCTCERANFDNLRITSSYIPLAGDSIPLDSTMKRNRWESGRYQK